MRIAWRRRSSSLALLMTIAGLVTLPAATSPAKPPADGGRGNVSAFRVAGDGLTPCPPVDRGTSPFVRGGCRLFVSSNDIDVVSRTVFGNLPFSYDCSFAFDLHIARDGRTTMDRLLFGGVQGGCGDIRPCEPDALKPSRYDRRNLPHADPRPWRGRLVELGRGRYVNRVELCFDTCAGRFDGRFEFLLERRRRGWIARVDGSPIGATGMALTGTWDVVGPDVRLRRQGAAAQRPQRAVGGSRLTAGYGGVLIAPGMG